MTDVPEDVEGEPVESNLDAETAADLDEGAYVARPRASGSARSGWLYLLVLTLISAGVIAWGYAGRESAEEAATTTTTEVAAAGVGTPAAVNLAIAGSMVDLQGSLPDEGAVSQLVSLAVARYGDGNVTSALVADPVFSLTGGVVTVSGTAEEGDDGPGGLQADVAAAFGFEAGAFDLVRVEAELTPVRADAIVGGGTVELSGAFPDRAAADQYILAANEIYGADSVQSFNVSVDPKTTLNGALFGISGLVDAGDIRATAFQDTVLAFFGGSNADTSGLEIDTSPEALARLEERLRADVEAEPILFASGQATLDPGSDPVLVRIAEAIVATPGVNVEIVGHTDGEGGVEINQEISERRANAVLDRLVQLGVAPERLRARGAGESEPIADNETDEGRAANRRIAFEFDGAG